LAESSRHSTSFLDAVAYRAGFRRRTVAFLYAVGGFGFFTCTACVQYFENAPAANSVNPE
jgi:hypothetical protein